MTDYFNRGCNWSEAWLHSETHVFTLFYLKQNVFHVICFDDVTERFFKIIPGANFFINYNYWGEKKERKKRFSSARYEKKNEK